MKKLLLLALCALPLSAMQEESKMQTYIKRTAAPTLLASGTIMTTTAAITRGGCTLFPPLTLLLGGAYAMKKGYDWYYKQELVNKAKGN
jgi:hypothetical protein